MSSQTPENKLPGASLPELLAAADKLDRLLYKDMAAAVRHAIAVIARDHPDWYAEGMIDAKREASREVLLWQIG